MRALLAAFTTGLLDTAGAAKVKRALGDGLELGLELGLDLPSISELETLFNVNAWSIRALHVLESRPVLEVAKLLLDEGSSLFPRTRPWVLLQREIRKAESWKAGEAGEVGHRSWMLWHPAG
jgi:hypothetical protein